MNLDDSRGLYRIRVMKMKITLLYVEFWGVSRTTPSGGLAAYDTKGTLTFNKKNGFAKGSP